MTPFRNNNTKKNIEYSSMVGDLFILAKDGVTWNIGGIFNF